MAEIELKRPTGYRVDSGREYQIVIDREKVGSIGNGETKTFSVSPGHHELQLKQDWGASERLQVDLDDNDRAQFVCAPRIKENDVGMVSGLRAIYWITLGCRRYIDLRQGNDVALIDEPNWLLKRVVGPKLVGIALLIGIAFWVLTGQSIVAMGVIVAAMALVVGGLVGRGVGKVAVQTNQEVRRRRDD